MLYFTPVKICQYQTLSESNYFGVSSFYEIENLTNNNVNKDIRLGSYLQLDYNISENIHLLSTTYYQPNMKKFKDFKTSSQTQLNFEFKKGFSFINSIEMIYDSCPAVGVKTFSYSFQNGVQYNF